MSNYPVEGEWHDEDYQNREDEGLVSRDTTAKLAHHSRHQDDNKCPRDGLRGGARYKLAFDDYEGEIEDRNSN